MRRVLAGIVLLIVYGSLFPWHFALRPAGPMLQWPHTLTSDDALVNLVLYLPVGACAYFAYPLRGWRRVGAPVAISLALSLCMELGQVFVPGRSSELTDVLLNTAGGALGVAVAALLPQALTVEGFLLVCWVLHLAARHFDGWATECAGVLVAASVAMPERTRRWRWLVAVVCVAAVLVRGLRPFAFVANARAFLWIPFGGFLASQTEYGIGVLFAKLFWYGAGVWAIRRLGAAWWMAGAAVAVELGAIEAIQRYMPTHVAEITDPLMALLLAGAFAAVSTRPQPQEAAEC